MRFVLALGFLNACSEHGFIDRSQTPADPDGGDEAVDPVYGDEGEWVNVEDCEDGYWADFYNLPADHPEVEGSITGWVQGDRPENHDWWDDTWYVFTTLEPDLEYGDQWWPVDTGVAGDPQYYAVHFVAHLDVPQDMTVRFEMGSDDDGWAYIDGHMVADLGGIHAVVATEFDVDLQEGVHRVDLYMAERHTSNAGFWFRWLNPEVGIYACP